MTHDEANELLAALALDAVEPDERVELEQHVATCPRCRSELDSLRNVAATIGNSVEPLPEGLWSSISSRLYETDGRETPPMPRLVSSGLRSATPRGTAPRRGASRRMTRTGLSIFAAAAAAIIIALGVSLAGANNRVTQLQTALSNGGHNAVAAALQTPGHRLVTLDGTNKVPVAKFVVLPDGRGYLVSSHLPTLSTARTYQLWVIEGHTPISVGLMGRAPGTVTFTMAGSPHPSQLAITVEPAGGSQSPSTSPVASGAV